MQRTGSLGRAGEVLCAGLFVFALLTGLLNALPGARAAELTGRDARCAGCHFHPGLTKALPSGERIAMSLSREAFGRSEHAEKGCVTCHDDIKLLSHPATRKSIASAHDYAVAAQQNCAKCHEDSVKAWQAGGHGAAAAGGNADTALCLSCHDPHAPMAAARLGATAVGLENCTGCHDKIGAGFAAGVHTPHAVQAGEKLPLCTDCHGAHPATVADNPGTDCLTCHEAAPRQHAEWLPNAPLHLAAISCAACHTPNAPSHLELRLQDGAGKLLAATTLPATNTALDESALLKLAPAGALLRPRIAVADAAQAHALGGREGALHSCQTCHSADAAPFASVRLISAGPDGRATAREMDPRVLASLGSLATLGNFYVVGATRIGLFDVLVGLALLAGLGLPAVHLLLGVLIRRRRASGDGQ